MELIDRVMKRYIFISILALAAVVSCQKIEDSISQASQPDAVKVVHGAFNATIEDTPTRAYLSGTNVYWNDGDLVAVFPGTTSAHKYMVAMGSDGKSSAQLVEQPYSESEPYPEDDIPIGANVALYPYYQSRTQPKHSENTCEDLGDGKYRVNVEFDGRFPMVAVTQTPDDKDLLFKQTCGLLKFSLLAPDSKPFGLTGISIIGNNNEILCGSAEVTASYGADPEIEMIDGEARLEVYSDYFGGDMCDEDGIVWLDADTPFEFCVPVPPTVFTKGIKVIFLTTQGFVERTINQEIVVERAHIKPFSTLQLTPGNTVLLYESTDGNIVTPARLSAKDKDGASLQYENVYGDFFGATYGQIRFNGIVESMDISFEGCMTLDSFLMSSNVVKLVTAEEMFSGCSWLTYVELAGFDFSDVTSMRKMFNDAQSLHDVWFPETGLNTSKVTSMRAMFSSCYSLAWLDLSGFDTSNVTDMCAMFQNCFVLSSLDISTFNTSKVTDMSFMFNACQKLYWLDMSGFDTSNVTDMRAMFQNCNVCSSLDMSSFDTSKVTDMSYMFNCCSYIQSMDLSGFNTSAVQNMKYMFQACESLQSLDLSNFDTSNVTDMDAMFIHCSNLEHLDISSFDTSNVTSVENMFSETPKLKSLRVGEKTNACSFDPSMFDQIGYGGTLKYPAACDYSQWLEALAAYGWTGEGEGEVVMEAVDLGLSVKWASCNLGASKPEEYGDYYAWGATEPWYEKGYAQSDNPVWKSGKSGGYIWENCPFRTTGNSWNNIKFSKYVPDNQASYWGGDGTPDNKEVLDLVDDAANVKMGGGWRMPTVDELWELVNNCTSECTTLNGVAGRRFTSKTTGNSIFLPAAGDRDGSGFVDVGIDCGYWSSSLHFYDPVSAWLLHSLMQDEYMGAHYGSNRCAGRHIRPVYSDNTSTGGNETIGYEDWN